jgi:hypothetical protein
MRYLYLLLIAAVLLLAGCASVPKVQYSKSIGILLPDKPEAEQTINGITIQVRLMDVGKEVIKDKYLKDIMVYHDPWGKMLGTYPVPTRLNIFSGVTTFEVTIINNTDQILKLEESRIMYIDPVDVTPVEPYMALNTKMIAENLTVLPIYDQVMRDIQKLNPQSEAYKNQVGVELMNLVKQQKFVNEPTREVMPGMKFTGLVMIPISSQNITEGKLSFVDMVTKSATAGYATEKVRFDYAVRGITRYWKQDKAVSTDWVEITAEEYKLARRADKESVSYKSGKGRS